ncbi:MAG: redoxin domain-containing protein [Flavobacteriales bacterium]|nr:redoxin domain-containing protein [Flavobacteriales bacterium]
MKKLYIIATLLFTSSILIAQVQLLPSIGLSSQPQDADAVCTIVPRTQGNPWIPVNVGDTMADFTLWDINGNSVTLSNVLNSGKRVLMVAGSYTCPIFRNHMTELNQVAAQFGNDIECFVVYTVEAHPTGSVMPSSGNVNPTNPPYYQPTTYLERKNNVSDMLNGVGSGNYVPTPINVPVYIDGPCNEWWQYYDGPNNAYLIDTNGVLFAYHSWFNNTNPPSGPPTNIWCDIDSLLGVNSANCTQVTSLAGTFDFQLKVGQSASVSGNSGDIIDIFGELINTSNSDGVKVNLERVLNTLPSQTWSSSMCTGVCLPSTQDTASVILSAGDTLDFSFHFFTDPLMAGPDTAMAKVKFTNDNGSQSPIQRMYRGITVGHATYVTDLNGKERKLKMIVDVLGRDSKHLPNVPQFYIYDDGTVEKRIVIE